MYKIIYIYNWLKRPIHQEDIKIPSVYTPKNSLEVHRRKKNPQLESEILSLFS